MFGVSWVARGASYWARRVLVAGFLLGLYGGVGVLATYLWARFLDTVVPAGSWRPVCWAVMALGCLGAFVWGVRYQRQHPQPVRTPAEARAHVRSARRSGVRRGLDGRVWLFAMIPVLPAIVAHGLGSIVAGTLVREVPNEIGARREWEQRKHLAHRPG